MSNYSNPPGAPYPGPPVPPPLPRPKKSGSTVWIVLGSVVAVVVLVCFGITAVAMMATDTDGGTDSGSKGSDADAGGDDEAEPKAAAMGDVVSDGTFEFTVTKVEDGVDTVGDDYIEEKATGQFVIVHVTVKNIGDQAELFMDSDQKLVDTEGKQYDADSEAGIYIEGNEALLENINPGNTIDAQLVFDVPDEIELEHILLFGTFDSEGTAVSLTE